VSFLLLSRPRALVSFLLEGGILFLSFHFVVLASLRGQSAVSLGMQAWIAGLLFTAVVLGTRTARMGGGCRLRWELLAVALSSLALGLLGMLAFGRAERGASLAILEGVALAPVAIGAWRWISLRYEVFDGYRERVLILGVGANAKRVCQWLIERHDRDFAVVGFAAEDPALIGQLLAKSVRVRTDFKSLVDHCAGRVDRIVVALDEKRGKLPIQQLMQLRLKGIEVEEATGLLERISGKIAVETMLPSWLIFSDGFKASPLRSAMKRLMDIVLSALLLLLASPLMLVTALLIRLDSPGPVLFRQRRVGRAGREFDVFKFRSMVHNAEGRSGPVWATRRDPRVTRVGRVIRLLRIDELPQLWNVLDGHMSFVGPRPERPHFIPELEREIPYYGLRTAVRPGITGWAQVQYRYGASTEDAREKLKYDLFYIKNAGPLFDLWIVLKTVQVVVSASGAR